MQDLRPIVQLFQKQTWVTSRNIRTIMGCVDEEIAEMAGILVERGLPLVHDKAKGYSLDYPVSLIDKERLISLLTSAKLISAKRLSVLDEIDSTNNKLLSFDKIETLHGRICIAEYQNSGRGRHGRSWVAAGYQNLTFSLAWRIQELNNDLSSMSLVVGLALCLCLEEIVGHDVKLKWPNDIVCADRKLAGILVETRRIESGEFYVVIGVGVNIKHPDSAAFGEAMIGRPIAELSKMIDEPFDRTEIFVKLLSSLHKELAEFDAHGFINFVQKWNDRDACIDHPVVGTFGKNVIHGKGLGVDDTGAYRIVDTAGHMHRLISGELRIHQEVSSICLDQGVDSR